MANYCEDSDLIKVRPKILSYNVSSWSDQATKATAVINRSIINRWYKQAAYDHGHNYTETIFDQDLLLNAETQLTDLAVYKTLQLAYEFLMKDNVDDAFREQAKYFEKKYDKELSDVLATGLDYDWDGSEGISSTERYGRTSRTLERV